MSLYQYTAKDSAGKVVKGSVEKDSLGEFYSYLRSKNLYCIDFVDNSTEVAEVQTIYKFKTKELVLFCRKLGTMLSAGVSMNSSLETLYETAESPKQKKVLAAMYENVQAGYSLSAAMRSQGRCFPIFMINMVESGEESGNLDGIVIRLADNYEKENRQNAKIKAAMTYPVLLLSIAFLVIIGLFTFVLPSILKIYENSADIPGITRFVMGISDFMVANWLYIVMFIVLLIGFIANAKYMPSVKAVVDKIKLSGMFKKTTSIIYSSRFARSMSILYSSGISLMACLRLSSNILNNTVVTKAFVEVSQMVSSGESLSRAVGSIGIFDSLLPSMIRVGEESGRLDYVLETISDYYETETDGAISRLLSIIEPVMLIILAVVIVTIMIAVMAPIMGSYSQIT